MASPTQHTEKVRATKRKPNKMNQKADRKRVRKNLDVLAKKA